MSLPGSTTPLAPRRRFLGALLAWALIFLGGPGVAPRLHPVLSILTLLGVALWALVVSRDPGDTRSRARRAFLVEWGASALGWSASLYWVAHVFGPALLYVALGMGFYGALAGWLARRLLRRFPLAPATALAWVGAEGLRALLPQPIGLGWLQLGHHLVDVAALLGSARVFGIEGLSVVAAGLACGTAGILVRGRAGRSELFAGLAPFGIALLAGLLTTAPESVPGPSVLLVQPGFEQARKQYGDRDENYRLSRSLTLEAVRALDEPPDLVCWGESMLPVFVTEPGVREALERGANTSISIDWLDLRYLDNFEQTERVWVHEGLLGGLPEGTSFLTGAEALAVAENGSVGRLNAVVLYRPDGSRSPAVAKQYLVPGAETLLGLEQLAFARDVIHEIAGYVPDLRAGERTGVLELRTRTDELYRLGATVCFDNAFLGPYVEPIRRSGVDAHVIVSNEAWYRDSWEMDQMVAVSRVIAAATGRSVVRATNSGVSCVIDPGGRELGRVRVADRDRSVAGTLSLSVPVPARNGAKSPRTPYVWLHPFLRFGIVLVPLLLLLVAGRRRTAEGGPSFPDERP